MKQNKLSTLFLSSIAFSCISAFVVPMNSHAEDLKQIFDKVQQYYQEKNYPKALEELSWAQKEIEKANAQVTQSFFPNEVEGFKGGEIDNTNVFGFMNVERSYEKGDSQSIKVSLIGSSKGQGQNPLGGLAAMGQMAAMMGGNQPGMDSFRLDGRTAMLEKEDSSASLTVFLDGGAMLKFEMNGSNNADELKKFAGGFKIGDIEKHLKG
jgi:hypothetical protein